MNVRHPVELHIHYFFDIEVLSFPALFKHNLIKITQSLTGQLLEGTFNSHPDCSLANPHMSSQECSACIWIGAITICTWQWEKWDAPTFPLPLSSSLPWCKLPAFARRKASEKKKLFVRAIGLFSRGKKELVKSLESRKYKSDFILHVCHYRTNVRKSHPGFKQSKKYILFADDFPKQSPYRKETISNLE